MASCKKNKTHNILNQNPKSIFGVTLVELMIAIVISSIVALGIGSVYTSSKRSYKLQEEFSRLQENGRFAMNYVARFIRSAGYSGCSSALDNMYNDINSTDVELYFQTGLEGYEANGTAPNQSGTTLTYDPDVSTTPGNFTTLLSTGVTVNINPATLTNLGVLPGSDIIIARNAADSGVEIVENNKSANFVINWVSTDTDACIIVDPADPTNTKTETGYNSICPDSFLIISDCNKSAAFQVSNMSKVGGTPPTVKIVHSKSGTPGNKSASWGAAGKNADPGFDYVTGDELVTVATKFFYVGKGVNGPALFMKQGSATPLELVEGVENLQVLYGVDADGDNIPDRYVPADQVLDFALVTAVRLSILVRSVKNLPWRTKTGNTAYLLGGATGATATTINAPDDQRLRRIMTMTIKLRNRAFSL